VKKLVFLLEEESMSKVLENILPKILPTDIKFQCVPHKGKSDLHKSIPIKLRAWNEPNVSFVVVHDKDSWDCIKLKNELSKLARTNKRPDTLIRIVCTELESWFLGDISSIEKAFKIDLSHKKNKALFRNPDNIANAKEELKKLIPLYQQISGSDNISKHMNISNNTSHSFHVFISGVKYICKSENAGCNKK
jgi:hypothetical protein